jgi:hypothetical protein
MWASQTESHAEDPPLRLPGWFADVLAQAPESQSSRLPAWVPRILGAQPTIIDQGVLPFHSPYRDANSFNANGDNQVSQTYGLYLGSQLTTRLQFYFDVEMFQGDGISNGRALGGLTNGASSAKVRCSWPRSSRSTTGSSSFVTCRQASTTNTSRTLAATEIAGPRMSSLDGSESRAQNPKVVGSNPTRRGRSITG